MSTENCASCHGARFMCEQHPARPWPHEDCAGPGVPCPVCQEAETRPALPEGRRAVASTLKRPNELLWELRKGHHTITCEPRYHGEYGVAVQFCRDGADFGGMRFSTRAEAVTFAEEERTRHLEEAHKGGV